MIFRSKKIEKIKLLPNTMKERGEFLLRNPRKGKETLTKTPSKIKLKSNCFGTTIFLKGEKSYNKCEKIYEKENDPFICRDMPSIYWQNNNRPGLIEVNIMQKFIEKYCIKTENPSPGDMVVVDQYYKEGYWLAHTGIWTGIENYVLEQHNKGKNFGLEKLEKHFRPYFVREK